MRAQPFALAGVAGEHLRLARELRRHVDDRRRLDRIAHRIDHADRVAVVQVRNSRACDQWVMGDVRRAVHEAGLAGEQRDHLVVHHVVLRRVGEHERGRHAAEQVDRFLQARLVVTNHPVALVEAVIRRPDLRGRREVLPRADRADLPAVVRDGPAVAGGRRGDVNLPPGVGQADERAGAEEFRIVRMGEEAQRDATFRSRFHSPPPLPS
jgi:hypothetical protein